MSKLLLFLLLALAALVAVARDKPARWTEVSSPHFMVVGDSGEKDGRRIAVEFERMREVFERLYPHLEEDSAWPITILAIKNREVFRALEPPAYLQKGSLKLHGLFLPTPGKSYILMRLDAEGGNPLAIAIHEYTHLMLHHSRRSIPLWLSEGLAEFYANTNIRDTEIVLGQANQGHLLILRNERWLPLATLFTIDEHSPYYIEKGKGSIFYAESWALTHYLTLKDYEERTSTVEQYTKLTATLDPTAAALAAFGDLKKLQKDLEDYVERENFDQFRTAGARMPESDLDIESITPIQAQAVQADFLACSGRLAEARALVQSVLRDEPGNPSAQETLAFLDSADEAETEEKLRSAVQQEPSSATAYDRLASFLRSRGKDLDEAKRFEVMSVYLDAGNVNYRLNLADILLSMELWQSAANVLRDAASIVMTPQQTKEIEQRLAAAEKYASTRVPDMGEARDGGEPVADKRQSAQSSMAAGPLLFLVGILKHVHCSPPALDLTVTSRAKTVTLHSENYYKIQFTALFTPEGDLNPCDDLENRRAKVAYFESTNASENPRLVAVELHK
jgi:hypothetical protein